MTAITLLLLLLGSELSAADISTSTIRFLVVNSVGEQVESYRVKWLRDAHGKDFSRLVIDGRARVPYGTYTIEVSSAKGLATQRIQAYHDSVLSVVNIGGIDYPDGVRDDVIRGMVLGAARSRQKLWIRAVSLFGSILSDRPIEPDGTFSFYNLPPGSYMMFLFDGGTLLATKRYSFKTVQHPPIVITVK